MRFLRAGDDRRWAALLALDPRPSVDRIASWLDPNLCRCYAYPQIVRAVQRAAEGDDLRDESSGVAIGRWTGDFLRGRPSAPWDLTDAESRDYFAVLSEGFVVVAPPAQACVAIAFLIAAIRTFGTSE